MNSLLPVLRSCPSLHRRSAPDRTIPWLEIARGGPDAVAEGAGIDGFTRAIMHPDTPSERPEAPRFNFGTKEVHPHLPEEIERRQQNGGANYWDALPDIPCPNLLMTGDADVLGPPENSSILAQRIPNGELQVIEGGGHICFIEQPRATNAVLLGFLGRHPIQSGPGLPLTSFVGEALGRRSSGFPSGVR